LPAAACEERVAGDEETMGALTDTRGKRGIDFAGFRCAAVKNLESRRAVS